MQQKTHAPVASRKPGFFQKIQRHNVRYLYHYLSSCPASACDPVSYTHLDGQETIESLQDRITGRYIAETITDPDTGEVDRKSVV